MSVDLAGHPANDPVNVENHPNPSVAGKPQTAPRAKSRTRARIVQVLSVLILAGLLFAAWKIFGGKTKKAGPERTPSVAVETAAASQRDVPIQIKGIGNVEALSTVSVRSQITGTLQSVFFTPGQETKKGDLLFRIDPRPLQAALNTEQANLIKSMTAVSQARAIVAKDTATAVNLRGLANRDAKLVETGVIASQDYDNAVANAEAAEAAVKADRDSVNNLEAGVKAQEAIVQNARVQLGYTDIRAPITGKTGNLTVTAGNLVNAGETTALVTITQATPIYVTFSIPQQELEQIRKYQNADGFAVQSFVPNDTTPTSGKLSLVDNVVDTTTGTVKLKATFENGDRRLYPGQYVNVVLTLGYQKSATVVPSQAVQIGQNQTFIYVVKPDMTVEVRKVQTGTAIDNVTVIENGIQPGEKVVTDGQLSLVPGSKVQPKSDNGNGGGGRGRGGQGGTDSGGAGTAGPAAGQGSGNGQGGTGGGTSTAPAGSTGGGNGGPGNGSGGSGTGTGGGSGTGSGSGTGGGSGTGSGSGTGGGAGGR